MQNIETREEDFVDLGVATEETKGGIFGVLDVQQSLYINGGISDD
ncbi:benenodin family lasso peptide [Sphingobium sp. EM0848]|nr:benenodin family lasso peptide [Sphingobium sp. EM0848]